MKSSVVQNNQPAAAPPKPFFNKGKENSFFSKHNGQVQPYSGGKPIQASLVVGKHDDAFEREAEQVAAKVVNAVGKPVSPNQTGAVAGIQAASINHRISRMPQTKCDECEKEDPVQKKSTGIQFAGGGGAVATCVESNIESMRGSGQSMDATTKAAMEKSFGADFSGVRLHTSNNAAQLSKDLNAHAFTTGSDIFFNEGRYDPSSEKGVNLLAHELTHTIQQGHAVQNTQPSYASQAGGSAAGVQSKTGTPGIQKADVLENDMSTVPAGLTCPVSAEKVNDANASLDVTFDQGGALLSAADITNIAVFVNNWQSAALHVPVKIHGYASIDGTPNVNWPLSCRRAEALSKEMQKVQPAVTLSTGRTFTAGTAGIPASFIQIFAHGETDEFSSASLLQNRRATVFVPNIPALPAKLAKSPQAKLKSGPTYTPNGVAALTTNTATSKATSFTMAAEFENDPANGIFATCGEIRQYIKWSGDNVDPGRGGHEGFLADRTFIPGTFYEDRDQSGKRYGHRQGPHAESAAGVNEFLDAAGNQDPLNGTVFNGLDAPSVTSSAAFIATWTGTWEFRLEAIDTCNGDKVLGTDNVKIDF